ncbi:MAG: endonuclease/exonuclease/phosphatase family protein [Candidatus Sumerlaeia bacterium]|nr:endonuclease/exonuclease/phosphatase family protein [Candidatus Sumerlaeia bacterium]
MKKIVIVIFLLLFGISLVFANDLSTTRTVIQEVAETTSLRIMTYNIHIGKGIDGKLDLGRIAEVINSQHPDVVALQEVDRFTERCGKIDQLAELERLTGLKGVYGKTIDFQGGEYGIAILSRLKIVSSKHNLLPEINGKERRGFLKVIVEKNGQQIAFINTHLGLDSTERQIQIAKLLEEIGDISEPLIIAGDFNELPGTENWQLLNKNFMDVALQINNPLPTYPATNPEKRIDYIWLHRKHRWNLVHCQTISTLASDHLPLCAEIKLGSYCLKH